MTGSKLGAGLMFGVPIGLVMWGVIYEMGRVVVALTVGAL